MMTVINIVLAAVVVWRCVVTGAAVSPVSWTGTGVHFYLFAMSFCLLAAGAIGVAIGHQSAGSILLAGVSLKFVFDRRRW